MKPIIELNDVWKVYQMEEVEVPALQGLNLKVYPKEFVSIVGKSGSGKSTALNLIGCLDTPTKGTIHLDKQDISRLEESDLAQIRGKKIGFIFQVFNLIPQLTALENVLLPTIFTEKNTPEQERKHALELIEKVGLTERMNHLPSQLSGGERQRVAIARALINNPEVILADEPTGNLDSKTGIEVMNTIQKLHKEGKTIILITHDSSLARKAQKIYTLHDGKIISQRGAR